MILIMYMVYTYRQVLKLHTYTYLVYGATAKSRVNEVRKCNEQNYCRD